MAKQAVAEQKTDRAIVTGPRPSHLAKSPVGGGPGRTRIPTEFDDQVLEWYKQDDWAGVSATGETDEEKKADFEEIYKALKRAADFHELGIERIKDEDNYVVWVNIRDKQSRGPMPGSIRDPQTNKMVKPGTDRYDEIMAERNGDTNPDVVSQEDHEF
jgi:hypothetical protein